MNGEGRRRGTEPRAMECAGDETSEGGDGEGCRRGTEPHVMECVGGETSKGGTKDLHARSS